MLVEGNGKPTLSIDPKVTLGKRKQKADAQYTNRILNKKVVPDYDPENIYEMKVLPSDERAIKKFNSATF